MRFELTPELADLIIFGMENQARDLLLDTREAKLVPLEGVEDDPGDPERFIPLPDWRPVDGYALMERFVSGLRNPIHREALQSILSSGRGVFRRFKDAVKERRELELLWFRFREGEMRKVVVEWYRAHREAWGLAEVEIHFEETGDLVLSDFTIHRWADPDEGLVRAADRAGFRELFPRENEEELERLCRRRPPAPAPGDGTSLIYKAETPGGGTAGLLWALREGPGEARVRQIYVFPEYRGLGLARALIRRFREEAAGAGIYRIGVELMGEALRLGALFREEGFSSFSEVLVTDCPGGRRESAPAG